MQRLKVVPIEKWRGDRQVELIVGKLRRLIRQRNLSGVSVVWRERGKDGEFFLNTSLPVPECVCDLTRAIRLATEGE